MTFSIGRCTFVKDPHAVQHSGNQVTFTVGIGSDTSVGVDAYNAMRQQVLGLANNYDEPVVPIVWSSDTQYEGFYRVTDVSLDVSEYGYLKRYSHDCQITAERVGGYSNPYFEVTTQSIVRTNAFAFTTPSGVVATLLDTTIAEGDLRPSLTTLTPVTRKTSTGASIYCYVSAAPVALTQFRTFTLPNSFYVGACRIEVLYGSTWCQVVGRAIPLNRVWRLSNDIVRLTAQNGATPGTIEIWDNVASAWEATNISHYELTLGNPGIGGSSTTTNPTVTVLRNSPEQCTVRVSGYLAIGSGQAGFDITYTVQRGAHFVEASWTYAPSLMRLGVQFSSVTACSSLTGGVRATSNDAAGNRVVFAMASGTNAIAVDLTNGRIRPLSSQTSASMMIGVELNGSSAITNNTADDLISQFFGLASWRQQVIGR